MYFFADNNKPTANNKLLYYWMMAFVIVERGRLYGDGLCTTSFVPIIIIDVCDDFAFLTLRRKKIKGSFNFQTRILK
jgi:hypothetical protein